LGFRAYRQRNLVSQRELGILLNPVEYMPDRVWRQMPHWRVQRTFRLLEAREKTLSPGFEGLLGS
jgi:hypothetical protein